MEKKKKKKKKKKIFFNFYSLSSLRIFKIQKYHY